MATSCCVVASHSYGGEPGGGLPPPSPPGCREKQKMPCGYVYPTRHVDLQHSRLKTVQTLANRRLNSYNGRVVRNLPLCGWVCHPRRSPGATNTWGLPQFLLLKCILHQRPMTGKPYFVTNHPATRGQPQDNGGGPRFVVQGGECVDLGPGGPPRVRPGCWPTVSAGRGQRLVPLHAILRIASLSCPTGHRHKKTGGRLL